MGATDVDLIPEPRTVPLLTIAYITFREQPRFEWFVASLNREFRNMPDIDRSTVQVLVIDARYPRKLEADFPFEHHAPKPTVWQGAHRLTRRDYSCASNARNTAFALSRHTHVAFVDDLSVLLPGWLKTHVHAATNNYVLAGTTYKHRNIVVDTNGDVASYDVFGRDFRATQIQPVGLVRCSGAWLYGGTFSVPLEHALRVNGQDEIYDVIGGADYDLGERLQRAGSDIFITRECGTFEDKDAHYSGAQVVRLDKPWPPTAVHAPRTFGPDGWSDSAQPDVDGDGPYSSNYLYNRLRREWSRSWTIGNTFNLRELRARVLAGEPFPIPTEPTTHWVDGQPLSEM